jgi:3'-phosphoadenosine 5'-phosphosulfate sulfotransferase (PAPS reductase)/FAD synthetase
VDKKELSLKILNDAYCSYKVEEIWALFSGGHDSLVNTHLVSQYPAFRGVLHIDTGTGIKETQDYVIETCAIFGWELKIYKASEYINKNGELKPQIYSQMVLEHGFPGPPMHQKMYNRLKELPLRHFLRDWQKISGGKVIGLATGCRKEESIRRFKNITKNGITQKHGRQVWINAIADWTKDDCEQYMKAYHLPRNPVKDNLCMSGECLCGAFAQPNELKQIEYFYPEKGKEIRALEQQVKSRFPWGWDETPPAWWSKKVAARKLEECGQLNLFSSLCTSCEFKYEAH